MRALWALEPSDRPQKFWVGDGLYLHVSQSGIKSWRVKFVLHGKEQLRVVGRFPVVDIDQAKMLTAELKKAVRAGLPPPRETAVALSKIPTFFEERIKYIKSLPAQDGQFVYFIHAPRLGVIKIGKSQNPEARLRDLQTAQPYTLELLATMPGGGAHEAMLHLAFQDERERGEWFNYSDRLRNFIEGLR